MSTKINKCPHLDNILQLSLSELCKLNQGVSCRECKAAGPNVWICLHKDCLYTGCSEQANDHSTKHFQQLRAQHCIQMNLSSQRTWCYLCESEVFLNVVSQRRMSIASNNDASDNNTARYSEKVVVYERNAGGGGGESCDSSGEDEDGNRTYNGGLVGLQNLANTCYMNAALQALSNSPPLTGYFLDCGGSVDATAEMMQNQRKFGLAKNYHKLVKEMWSKNRRNNGYVVPSGILSCIRNVYPMFRGFQQHDTQEFLRCFMDQLHEELKEVTPPPPDLLLNSNHIEYYDDRSTASSPSQSEAEYETCDSGVSEQSNLSDDGCINNRRENRFQRPASPISQRNLSKNHRSTSGTSLNSQRGGGGGGEQQHPVKLPHRSIISDVFDGKLLSSVQCLTCDRVSTREETFQDLSLPIPGKDHLAVIHHNHGITAQTIPPPPPQMPIGITCSDAVYRATQEGWIWWLWNWFKSWMWGPAVTLYDCMAAFFSADELKGDNMYSCEKCNKLRNGVKFSRVLALPEMLCVHLKRFRHDLSYSSKISSPVHFPITGLDMRPYLHKDCESQISTYDLTAVICHHGTVGQGHYTSYAKHEPTKKWFEYDDQLVTEVTPEVVENCEAYVLFYRKSNPQMSLIRAEAIKLEDSAPPQASDIRFFVSRQWLNRFNTFAEPGPIDNWALLCPHGALPPCKVENILRLVYALPQPVWDYLYNKFGGGPACNHLYECETCRQAADSLSARQSAELERFTRLNDEFQLQDNSPTIYAISMTWFRQWQLFARGSTTEEPGPINNNGIAMSSDTLPIRNVRKGSDYAQTNTALWKFFHSIYGGGPEIILKGSPTEDKAPEREDELYNETDDHMSSKPLKVVQQPSKTIHYTAASVSIGSVVPTSDMSQNITMTSSVTSTISSQSAHSSQGAFVFTKTPKNVSFEDSGAISNSTLSDISATASVKIPKKDSSHSAPQTSGAAVPSSSELIRKDKKFRGMKSAGFFGADGKYSDYKIIDPEDHANNSNDAIKKVDEIMPLLHQATISSSTANDDDASKKSTQQRREKDKSGNNRNSNRKKIKLGMKKSNSISMRRTSSSVQFNSDSDAAV